MTVREISENDYSLSIPLYVKLETNDGEEDTRSFESIYESWEGKTRRAQKAYSILNEMIQEGARNEYDSKDDDLSFAKRITSSVSRAADRYESGFMKPLSELIYIQVLSLFFT